MWMTVCLILPKPQFSGMKGFSSGEFSTISTILNVENSFRGIFCFSLFCPLDSLFGRKIRQSANHMNRVFSSKRPKISPKLRMTARIPCRRQGIGYTVGEGLAPPANLPLKNRHHCKARECRAGACSRRPVKAFSCGRRGTAQAVDEEAKKRGAEQTGTRYF